MMKSKIIFRDESISERSLIDFLKRPSHDPDWNFQSMQRRDQELASCRIDDRELVLKYYRTARKGWENFRPIRFTRAWRSWQAAIRLASAGIATPAPRFVVRQGDSLILACDRIEAQQLYSLVRDEDWMSTNQKSLIREISTLLARLDQAGVTHGDLHPRNILIDSQEKAWLIDLDGVRIHKSRASFLKRRGKDENRLAKELRVAPTLLASLPLKNALRQ